MSGYLGWAGLGWAVVHCCWLQAALEQGCAMLSLLCASSTCCTWLLAA